MSCVVQPTPFSSSDMKRVLFAVLSLSLLSVAASANAQATWRLATKPESTVTNVTEESPEYRGALPAWRVAFPDPTPQVFRCRWNWQDHRSPHQQLAALRLLLESRHHGLEEPRGFQHAVAFGIRHRRSVFGLAGTVLLFMRWPIRRRWTGSNARNST